MINDVVAVLSDAGYHAVRAVGEAVTELLMPRPLFDRPTLILRTP